MQVCGSRCTVAIDTDGQVLSWGWNARATLGHGHRCLSLAADPSFTTQLISQAAHATCSYVLAICTLTEPLSHLWQQKPLLWFATLSASRHETEGERKMVRRNDEKKPRRIAALRGIEIAQISTGGWHCLALDSAGMVYAWGGNEYGQCHVDWVMRYNGYSYSLTVTIHSH